MEAANEGLKNAGNKAAEVTSGIGNKVTELTAGVTNTLNEFSNKAGAGVGASSEFLQSNSIVAKIAFIIFILIAFLFLMKFGILLISYFVSPSKNPYMFKGMIDGNYAMIISQDPNQTESIPVLRSDNKTTGAEFSWSFWIFINDLGTNTTNYQHIFNKGNAPSPGDNNLASVNNAPGVYLNPTVNSLHIIMNSVVPNDPNTIVDVSNIPIRNWVNVIIRLENTILDVYVNGIITSRLLMANVPNQNYNNVYICQNGGFSGSLSNLRYYSHALNIVEITGVVTSGPNLTVVGPTKKMNNYNYLSSAWYATN